MQSLKCRLGETPQDERPLFCTSASGKMQQICLLLFLLLSKPESLDSVYAANIRKLQKVERGQTGRGPHDLRNDTVASSLVFLSASEIPDLRPKKLEQVTQKSQWT